MAIESREARAEQDALDIVHESLLALGLPQSEADTAAPVLLAELRARLGGYLIDPALRGFAYTNANPGTEATREVFVTLDDPREDNCRTQELRDGEWVTLP